MKHSKMVIHTSFDFRSDSNGKDPDAHSATLRRYHQLLWSKHLPCGRLLDLNTNKSGVYLHHSSSLGEFSLASDSVIPSFTRWKRLQHIITRFPEEENEAFRKIGYTIGGMMIFPSNVINGQQTINGARGFTRTIADRFDLTLECIRLFYEGKESPLAQVLVRYGEFFALFGSFEGYVEFFLLHDLTTLSGQNVRFFMKFDGFSTPATPRDVAEYADYRNCSIEFVQARNRRVEQYVTKNLGK
jgi:hypothetical protein